MDELPPDLAKFSAFLEAQPAPVREVFHYCLCLMMVEIRKMRLVEVIPSDTSPLCVFETITGETFSVPRPPINPEEEAVLIATLRGILADEGML